MKSPVENGDLNEVFLFYQNYFIFTYCFPPTFKFRNVSQIWLYPMQLITTFHLINCFWYIDYLMFLSMFYQKIIFRIDSQHTCKCDSVVLICKKIIFSPSEKYLNKTNSMLVIVMPKMKTLTIHDKKNLVLHSSFKTN